MAHPMERPHRQRLWGGHEVSASNIAMKGRHTALQDALGHFRLQGHYGYIRRIHRDQRRHRDDVSGRDRGGFDGAKVGGEIKRPQGLWFDDVDPGRLCAREMRFLNPRVGGHESRVLGLVDGRIGASRRTREAGGAGERTAGDGRAAGGRGGRTWGTRALTGRR